MADELTGPLLVQIGKNQYPVPTIEQAQELFCAARDRWGRGASGTPIPRLTRGGVAFGYISYNGRAWAGDPRDWRADTHKMLAEMPARA